MDNEKIIISGAPVDPDNSDRDFVQVTETKYGSYRLSLLDKNGKSKFSIQGDPKRIIKLLLALMEIWIEDKCYEGLE